MIKLRRNYTVLLSVIFVSAIILFLYTEDIETSTNKQVIEEIKQKLGFPASHLSLNLSGPVHAGQLGQAKEIYDYFNGKKNGFFVEAGAFDGEYLSNTLLLEVNSSWTGLLVEPNKAAHSLLVSRNRAAHTINSCLSVETVPITIEFEAASVYGGIKQEFENVNTELLDKWRESITNRSYYKLKCYPLYSLLLALGNPKVDFLSLDIEGAEQAVLKTVPWDKVDIELVMIETYHSDRVQIDKIMFDGGYEVYKELKIDVIYRKIK